MFTWPDCPSICMSTFFTVSSLCLSTNYYDSRLLNLKFFSFYMWLLFSLVRGRVSGLRKRSTPKDIDASHFSFVNETYLFLTSCMNHISVFFSRGISSIKIFIMPCLWTRSACIIKVGWFFGLCWILGL